MRLIGQVLRNRTTKKDAREWWRLQGVPLGTEEACAPNKVALVALGGANDAAATGSAGYADIGIIRVMPTSVLCRLGAWLQRERRLFKSA